jgi:hypothetical protein
VVEVCVKKKTYRYGVHTRQKVVGTADSRQAGTPDGRRSRGRNSGRKRRTRDGKCQEGREERIQ